ncbi:MAG: tRNA lysidine(34) synthetase TilS [Elusimicrobiaceae bacterium]|nr:tRNA lysidine(34) synthetase TilS [Elusimicrobiaceae bacterium]
MLKRNFNARVWGRMQTFSRDNTLVVPGDRVLVAFSSGPDSVCLAHFLSHLAGRRGFSVALCHVNHGLRGGAKADEKFAASFARTLRLDCVVKKAAVKAYARREKLSTEHAARNLRYELLAQAAKELRCNKIATGHHLDDNAETVLLNLLRGTSPQGLTGIPLRRKLKNCSAELVRPLLCVTRAEIMLYLKHNGLDYRTDESNDCEDFTRNWVRKTLLPLLETKQPKFREHLLILSGKIARLIRERG